MLAFKNEKVEELLQRIALAFGMADPEVMHKGRFLDSASELKVEEGDTIYVRDERLAEPIALIVKYSEV